MASMKRNSIVLLSGGIDSTACIYYYLSQGFNVKSIFFDYGQIAKEKELISAKNVAAHYKIELNHYVFSLPKTFFQGEIKGRNAFFVFTTLLYNPQFQGIISLGIHSGVPYYDCSESFAEEIKKILDGYTNGQVVMDAPFLKWDKKMVYDYCKNNNVPVHLTYSCENSSNEPCGSCRSCLDRSALNVG